MNHLGLRPAMIHPGFGNPARAGGVLAIAGLSEEEESYDTIDGIAIIGVYGVLIDTLSYNWGRWATGYNQLRQALNDAFNDPEVHGIVLDIDSCGGMVGGCFDFIDWAFEAKAAAGKPVAAICSECAYSAAYAIASLADSIIVPRTGGVGSIGVVTMHVDYSGMFEDAGIKVTVLTAGDHKADGNPFEPLPADVRRDIEAELEAVRRLFAETVARNRTAAGHPLALEDILATEARTYDGPDGVKKAISLGLADAVASPLAAFEAFRAFVQQGN